MGIRAEWLMRVRGVDFGGKSQEGKMLSSMFNVKYAETDSFDDRDFDLAEQYLSEFSCLSTVQFPNTKISDQTLLRLPTFPKLELVNLRKCPNLSDTGIAEFLATRPDATTIISAKRIPAIQETQNENDR